MMCEAGVDISEQTSDAMSDFVPTEFDVVISCCGCGSKLDGENAAWKSCRCCAFASLRTKPCARVAARPRPRECEQMLCCCVVCAESSRTGTLTTRRRSTLEISQFIAACAMSAKARLGPHSVWDYRRDTTCEILAVLNTVLNTTLCFPRSRIFLATWREWLKRTHASEANMPQSLPGACVSRCITL